VVAVAALIAVVTVVTLVTLVTLITVVALVALTIAVAACVAVPLTGSSSCRLRLSSGASTRGRWNNISRVLHVPVEAISIDCDKHVRVMS